MPHPLLIVSQSDYLIQTVDISSHTEWQTVQIQISWLLQSQLICIYTICTGRAYPGSAGRGLINTEVNLHCFKIIYTAFKHKFWVLVYTLSLNIPVIRTNPCKCGYQSMCQQWPPRSDYTCMQYESWSDCLNAQTDRQLQCLCMCHDPTLHETPRITAALV